MRRLTVPAQAGGPRLVMLAEALVPPAPPVASEPAPDLAAQQKQEVDRQFEAARREGEARGLADADAAVAKRVDEIAARLRAEHELECERLDAKRAALAALIEGIEAALARQAREVEEVAVEAAFAAVVRILGDKAAERTLMRELCVQALQARGVGAATLRLSPGDLALVDLPDADLQLVADAALKPGQCVLGSSRGTSDTGLDVRLEAISRAFLDGLSAHRQQP
jgi:flagellar biosynthesis/type III secretory pathway protein FliH